MNVNITPFTTAYGELTISDNAGTTTMTLQNTYYPVTTGWSAGEVSRMTLNAVDGSISPNIGGEFETACTLSFSTVAAANTLEFAIFKNGEKITEHEVRTWIDSATYPNSVTIVGIDRLVAGDVLDVRVRCTTAAGIVITITNCNFNLIIVAR